MAKKDLYRDLPIYIPKKKEKRYVNGPQDLYADEIANPTKTPVTVTQPDATISDYTATNPGYTAVQPAQTVQPVPQPTEQPTGYQGAVSDALRRIADYGEYTSPYQPGIDAKYAAITGRQPFSYDLESDPQWAAYRKQYTRAGQMAYDDALAKLSARTGGLASSYAGGVAQQQYGDYMRQMTDKIPELYRLAYSMYADDAARDIADLNAIRGLDSDAYGRWGDAYGRLGDLYSLASGERSYADARTDKARADAIELAKLGAQYKDYSGLRALGINPAVGGSGGGKTLRNVGDHIGLDTDAGKEIAALPGAIYSYLDNWDLMDAETKYLGLLASGVDSTTAQRLSTGGDKWQAQAALEYGTQEYGRGDTYDWAMPGAETGTGKESTGYLSYRTGVDDGTKLTERSYNMAASGILEALARGNLDGAEQQINDIAPHLTEAQKKNLTDTLDRFGIDVGGL